ncbi:hypothetical protein [Streptomyces sp. TLI_105]|uniref:hypothetical protein n=1 Tax=Streptomyces sp. TLI_105 TaxID=1881019 RepID=UPI00089568FE|nr:hypothetical protein [Streptomyces sp. TLI_105]SEC80781.1 hypothetical protein SAMN05428939_3333 [Streptomyces sp. TLI_105]
MGIESDQLVYDYLSRVGDLAQQRQLPASDRRKLVSGLRSEIDRRRATHGEESPAAVRGILGALGTPDEVVDRAGPSGGRAVPGPRAGEGEEGDPSGNPPPAAGASGPAIPAQDTRGPEGTADWWRKDADADAADGEFLGFVGGIERPDLFEPPAPAEDEGDEAEEPAPGKARRLARILRLRKAQAPAAEEPEAEAEPAPRARLANPFVLLAALLLLGGAVFGSLVALAAGWLLAYASRRLTPAEIKGAVLVIPGLAAASGIAWLWGRVEGRWGEAVAPGGEAMGAAISETWPWVLRGAAIASSLFLLWRSRRH